MSTVTLDQCPEPIKLIKLLLKYSNNQNLKTSDHMGRTIFDINTIIENSCLMICRDFLINKSKSYHHNSISNLSRPMNTRESNSDHRSNDNDDKKLYQQIEMTIYQERQLIVWICCDHQD